MLRMFEIILVVLICAVTGYTFYVKSQASDDAQEIKRLRAEIKAHQNTIKLLRADWSLLNQPDRIQKLITTYKDQLQLSTTEPDQVAHSSELPKIVSQEQKDRLALAELLENGIGIGEPAEPDQVQTGSIPNRSSRIPIPVIRPSNGQSMGQAVGLGGVQ